MLDSSLANCDKIVADKRGWLNKLALLIIWEDRAKTDFKHMHLRMSHNHDLVFIVNMKYMEWGFFASLDDNTPPIFYT